MYFLGTNVSVITVGEIPGKSLGRKLGTGQAAYDAPEVPARTCEDGVL